MVLDGVVKDGLRKSLVAVEDFTVDDRFWRTFRAA